MSTTLETIEMAARQLTRREKALLAHTLLRELDDLNETNEAVEALWLEEAKRRYEAFRRGEMSGIPGDEVIQRLRNLVQP